MPEAQQQKGHRAAWTGAAAETTAEATAKATTGQHRPYRNRTLWRKRLTAALNCEISDHFHNRNNSWSTIKWLDFRLEQKYTQVSIPFGTIKRVVFLGFVIFCVYKSKKSVDFFIPLSKTYCFVLLIENKKLTKIVNLTGNDLGTSKLLYSAMFCINQKNVLPHLQK